MKKNIFLSMIFMFCSTLFLLTFYSGGLYLLDTIAREQTAQAIEKKEMLLSKAHTGFKKLSSLKKTENTSLFIRGAKDPIKIAFAGDTMFGQSNKNAMIQNGINYSFLQVKDEVNEADYAIVNLETAVTTRGTPEDKQYVFRTEPESLQAIKQAGFQMVSLANNHSMDYGEEGLLDTIDYLKQAQLEYVGAGRNSIEAYAAKFIEIKEKQIAILGFSRVLPDVSWYAGASKPGLASGYQLERMLKIIEETKRDVDYVLVFIHWGKERKQYPEPYQKDNARAMIESGADAIIGAHPHVIQGLDYHEGKPIAYSLGNFLFPDYVKGHTAESALLTLIIDGDDIQMQFTPYVIKGNQVAALTTEEQERRLNRLEEISWNVKRDGKIFYKLK